MQMQSIRSESADAVTAALPALGHAARPFQIALELNATNLLTATYNYTNCIEQHQDILGYLQDFVNSYKERYIPRRSRLSTLPSAQQEKVASLFRCPRNQCDPEPAVVLRLEHWRSTDLKANEELDESFVIIMGDHGLRGQSITHTRLGSLELNNPMFLISVPKKLRKSTDILSILRENAARLQTPYDIRATFLDILKYQPSSNFTDRSSMTLSGEYGVSFLRTQPDVERTCKNLPIPLFYCICHFPLRNVEKSSPMAVEAGKFLITYINSFLEQYDTSHKCETLEFSHTISMFAYVPEELTKTYRISVKATPPSNAEFRDIEAFPTQNPVYSIIQRLTASDFLKIPKKCPLRVCSSVVALPSAGSTDYVTGESSTYASLDDTTETPAAKLNPFDTCILPEYDPWDEDIVPFVDQEYNPLNNCNRKFKPMTTLKDGIVTVNAENVTCQGRCLTRRSDRANNRGRWVNVDEADFRCEIVETLCTDTTGKDVYQMVHAQVVEKNDTKLYKGNARSENYHNVYVILLDSISSTQGTRNLPQTMHFFEKSMEAVSFPHINKVGLNSRPNGVALWFGKSMEKVDRKLFGLPDLEPDWTYNYFCRKYVDNETFLMKEFSDRGYKTLLAEDWGQGTLNWPSCKGFNKQPTDHYMRPFQLALEKNVSRLLKQTYNKANCIEQHQDILRYLEDFVNSYEGIPKFGWIWLSLLGHDHESGVIHADPDFQRFLLHNKKKSLHNFVACGGTAVYSARSRRG
ncbi:hypothetical protein Y032_0230g2960 [Ancylostoma ceylanicum]|uniref:Uncharacterized protein n=2 Tax=Ancylostoma ceylanicum TaxID=53326 RepID=A0A016SFU9_9BILA|nr:hypothetical protein Y032_0230g2960 [Ancylostoma ceylanicum]